MVSSYVKGIVSFWRRQERNWRIVVTRMMVNRFFTQMTLDYANIYVRELGATPVQLGTVNSIAGLGNTLVSIPVGWLQDRHSLRKIFIVGVGLLTLVPLIYALALDWMMIIPGIFIAQLAMRQGSCVIICDISLREREIATGKALCEGLGSIPSIIAPTIAAFIITFFGGISVDGIRPLYIIQFLARCAMFIFIATQLKEITRSRKNGEATGF